MTVLQMQMQKKKKEEKKKDLWHSFMQILQMPALFHDVPSIITL